MNGPEDVGLEGKGVCEHGDHGFESRVGAPDRNERAVLQGGRADRHFHRDDRERERKGERHAFALGERGGEERGFGDRIEDGDVGFVTPAAATDGFQHELDVLHLVRNAHVHHVADVIRVAGEGEEQFLRSRCGNRAPNVHIFLVGVGTVVFEKRVLLPCRTDDVWN